MVRNGLSLSGSSLKIIRIIELRFTVFESVQRARSQRINDVGISSTRKMDSPVRKMDVQLNCRWTEMSGESCLEQEPVRTPAGVHETIDEDGPSCTTKLSTVKGEPSKQNQDAQTGSKHLKTHTIQIHEPCVAASSTVAAFMSLPHGIQCHEPAVNASSTVAACISITSPIKLNSSNAFSINMAYEESENHNWPVRSANNGWGVISTSPRHDQVEDNVKLKLVEDLPEDAFGETLTALAALNAAGIAPMQVFVYAVPLCYL
jgi:hypothetical protein